jgi:hypothetical protein
MRWFRVRKAKISSEMRDVFEQAGEATVRTLLFSAVVNREQLPDQLKLLSAAPAERNAALAWLTEKADQAERRETWNLAMEAAITVLVAFSLIVEAAVLLKS